ncbi:c-type cytochrome, partial [Burkholderia ambifaria]
MPKPITRRIASFAVASSISCALAAPAFGAGFGLGQPVDRATIAAWDIDVAPDGSGLPRGAGTVARGARVFADTCAMCHGPAGQGGVGDPLVGGIGSLTDAKPKKTVGSY